MLPCYIYIYIYMFMNIYPINESREESVDCTVSIYLCLHGCSNNPPSFTSLHLACSRRTLKNVIQRLDIMNIHQRLQIPIF